MRRQIDYTTLTKWVEATKGALPPGSITHGVLLATETSDGGAALRPVSIRDVDNIPWKIFTDAGGGKARQLMRTGRGNVVFSRGEMPLGLQVAVRAEPLDQREVAQYWQQRWQRNPWGNVATLISSQGKEVTRDELLRMFQERGRILIDEKPQAPAHLVGFGLFPVEADLLYQGSRKTYQIGGDRGEINRSGLVNRLLQLIERGASFCNPDKDSLDLETEGFQDPFKQLSHWMEYAKNKGYSLASKGYLTYRDDGKTYLDDVVLSEVLADQERIVLRNVNAKFSSGNGSFMLWWEPLKLQITWSGKLEKKDEKWFFEPTKYAEFTKLNDTCLHDRSVWKKKNFQWSSVEVAP